MTNISLRAYFRKIEHMLEDQLYDQALFHCRGLLEAFPKNFRSYQLTTRALLDSGSLEDADVGFDILLQIDPDDFVAHIGKSKVAESNNRLEEAVSHMKRAFELQPANEGLQEEVKRLLEKKDTVAPNKLMLTRGALIKMYMRGKLYEQATSEIKIGLTESPNRIDYQLALAESLMQTGKTIQAVEICVEIIKHLPYCLKANEIIYQVTMGKNHVDENDIYFSRLIELDPYYAYMLPTTQSVFDVPDIAVMIEEKIIPQPMEIFTDWSTFLRKQWEQERSSDHPYEANLEEVIQKIMDPSFGQPYSSMQIPYNQDGKMNREEPEDFYKENDELMEETKNKKTAFISKLRGFHEKSKVGLPSGQEKAQTDEGQAQFIENRIDEMEPQEKGPLEGKVPEEIREEGREGELAEPPAELQVDLTESIWVSDEEEVVEMSEKLDQAAEGEEPERLNDTQPIEISINDPELAIQEAEKAVNGGNFLYALDLLRPLIEQNIGLGVISRHLESTIEQHPDNANYLLLLGEVYTRMENREKALEIFQKAQKLISL